MAEEPVVSPSSDKNCPAESAREPVEIRLEVGREPLLTGAGREVAQRERRGVVERLTGA